MKNLVLSNPRLPSVLFRGCRSRRLVDGARAARCAVGSAALAAAACSEYATTYDTPEDMVSDADRAAMAASFLAAAGECGAYAHEPCDVLDPTCQSQLASIAACQWGGQGTPVTVPAINSLSSAMVRERLDMLTVGSAPPDGVQKSSDAVLTLLGLQPPGSDAPTAAEVTASLVLAFYEFDSNQTTLVEDASTGDARTDNALLFHELVHAHQDARYDLGALVRRVATTDSAVAFRGLFEGEAQFHQLIFELGELNLPSDPDSLEQGLDAFRAAQEPALFADPANAWQRSLLLAPYIYGPYSTLNAWYENGPSAMAQYYDAVPSESLRMLEAAFDREPTTATVVPFPAPNVYARVGTPLPVEGDEAYPLLTDRLGAWTIYALAQLQGKAELASELALGWRGDQLDVFQLAAGGGAGRLRVYFDTSAHASDFVTLMSENLDTEIRTSNTLVVVTVSEGETPEWLFGPLAM